MTRLFANIMICLLPILYCMGCVGTIHDTRQDDDKGRLAHVTDSVRSIIEGPRGALIDKYQKRAVEYEKAGEVQRALACWRVVSSLDSENLEATKKVLILKDFSREKAEIHFKQGVALYNQKSFKAAQREFLIVLFYDPEQKKALHYLKNEITIKASAVYEVQNGDTLASIAKKKYNDPSRAFLIAYFNDMAVDKKPVPGSLLEIPVVDVSVLQHLPDFGPELKKARAYFIQKKYRKVLAVVEKILKMDNANKQALDLKNAAYYELAESYRRQRKYVEALKMYKKVNSGYKGVKKDIVAMRGHLKEQAEKLYLTGVNHYVNEEFAEAIEYWQKTLVLDPGHPKAGKDIENAKRLLKKLKEVD